VGPAVAEYLGIPHVAWVEHMEGADGGIRVRQDLPDTCETVFMKYPCLITVERGALVPRLPSWRRMKGLRERPVEIFSFVDFMDGDEGKYGLSGSPTRVIRMFPPKSSDSRETWTGSGAELAERMKSKLQEMKVL